MGRRPRGWARWARAWVLGVGVMVLACGPGAGFSSAAPVRTGTLILTIQGLPPGTRPNAILTGPGLRRRVHVDQVILHRARPGRYTVQVLPLMLSRRFGGVQPGATAYPAAPGRFSVRVAARRTARLAGAYGSIVNPGVVISRAHVMSVIGTPGNPSAVVLAGRPRLRANEVLSLAPSAALPHGLLKRVSAVRFRAGRTTVRLRAVSVFAVIPVAHFDVPLRSGTPSAGASRAAAHSSGAKFGCGPTLSTPSGAYRTFSNAHLTGGWNTVSLFGKAVPVGAKLGLDFDLDAGINDLAGLQMSLSCQVDIPFNGMAGPIPVTGSVYGNVHASVGGGVGFQAGVKAHVNASVNTVGVPPGLLWVPAVSISKPAVYANAAAQVTVSAGFGAGVSFGLGNSYVSDASVNFDNNLDFSAQASRPTGSGCSVQATFGSFNASGKFGAWTIQSPSTPPLFTHTFWGPTSCEPGSPPSGGGGTPAPFADCSNRSFGGVGLTSADTAASWPDYGNGPQNTFGAPTATVFGSGPGPQVRWQICVGARPSSSSPTWVDASQPVVTGGTVYFLTGRFPQSSLAPVAGSMALNAVDEATGSLRWSVSVPDMDLGASDRPLPTPIIAGSDVVIPTLAGLHAYSASSGAPVWADVVDYSSGYAWEVPVVAGGMVYVVGPDGLTLNAVSATTGAQVWSAGLAGGTPTTSQPLAVSNGQIFIGSCYSTLEALDAATGAWEWTDRFSTAGLDATSSPLVVGAQVYVYLESGELIAVDAANGATQWRVSSSSLMGNLAYVGGTIAATDFGSIRGISAATGATEWTRRGDQVIGLTALGGHLAAITSLAAAQDQVEAIDPATGHVTWSQGITGTPFEYEQGTPIAAGSVMLTFVTNPTGTFIAAWK